MEYDLINGGIQQVVKFFTIYDLIMACQANPGKIVRFVGTTSSVGELSSWRGSYNLPAITPESADKTTDEVSLELCEALQHSHTGYKGGEYYYSDDQEFYVSPYGCCHEYKVVKAEVEDGELVLYTKLDPY